ncbi:hypothetical protein HGRIS_001119 [Hohenbuehelia grisea]|uniref:HAT C-terminal dimerisation domain-containing protein n=1 Tax=Hohenbuehelia grisea TaxID=104357 RepID=A0ABR3JQ78_9AGAR
MGELTTAQWWGFNAARYPVWVSLAGDYLSIMASAVSSERAFSSAGITITNRRSRLKPDIVGALQLLKCHLRHNLIFRETSSVETSTDSGAPRDLTEPIVVDLDDEGYESDGDDPSPAQPEPSLSPCRGPGSSFA